VKSDLGKLLIFIWLSVMAYFAYDIWIDVKYIADLMHVYVKMAMSHIGH
jgi:hypothetical protein|tara:strand:+ start:812 stop:958 length:147 start_codon:yes stop_codon:yes gene_type:complete